MRHPYTPIFRDLLDSSLWASTSPAIRCVWIAFLLDADPEGCIPTSVPGLARRANVTVEEARAAIALLEAPDPDSRTPDFEGRRVAKVPGGWQVLNFVAKRDLAKHEAEKARKRRWANAQRPSVANDNEPPMRLVLDATSATLDAPKPKPKSKPLSSEGEISPTPRSGDFVDGSPSGGDTQAATIHELPEGYQPSDGLRFVATTAGVKHLEHWVDKLRTIRIGGKGGILAHKLDEWMRLQVPQWRKWEEQEAFKDANSRAAATPGRRFGIDPGSPPVPERKRVQGAPEWVYQEHADFAKQQALDLFRAAKAYARQSPISPSSLKPADVFAPFMTFLQNLAEEREATA